MCRRQSIKKILNDNEKLYIGSCNKNLIPNEKNWYKTCLGTNYTKTTRFVHSKFHKKSQMVDFFFRHFFFHIIKIIFLSIESYRMTRLMHVIRHMICIEPKYLILTNSWKLFEYFSNITLVLHTSGCFGIISPR